MKASRLEELRENINCTKKEIATILGVSNSIYCRWENEQDSIPTIRLNQLANFYKVNIDYILNLTDKQKTIDINSELDRKLIALRTKETRKELGLTLREIGAFLNTTSSTWSAYETGKTLILSSFLIDICKNTDISADWILGRTNEKYR